MKYIGILDTSIMSFNLGDQIIMESARNGLKPVLDGAFVVNMPTHSPLFRKREFSIRRRDSFRQSLDRLDLKIVCGTNLLEKDMRKRKNSWNLHLSDSWYIRDFVLMGVGTDSLPEVANGYTRKLYGRMLSKDYIHSARDEAARKLIRDLGFEAIDTGCPTLWPLTPERCERIPTEKSADVVFTLTDYAPDENRDRRMIEILSREYENVYCWLQGVGDEEYLNGLGVDLNRICYIKPSLAAYNDFLKHADCDYVGTRLHGGVKAMQEGKRSIIIGVDNRARDIHADHNLNYLDRRDIELLPEQIHSRIETRVKINEEGIRTFLSQFA